MRVVRFGLYCLAKTLRVYPKESFSNTVVFLSRQDKENFLDETQGITYSADLPSAAQNMLVLISGFFIHFRGMRTPKRPGNASIEKLLPLFYHARKTQMDSQSRDSEFPGYDCRGQFEGGHGYLKSMFPLAYVHPEFVSHNILVWDGSVFVDATKMSIGIRSSPPTPVSFFVAPHFISLIYRESLSRKRLAWTLASCAVPPRSL